MSSALEGLRVLDLSRVLAGPLATQILGDLGATIIKVEKPGSGDDTRHWGPPFHDNDPQQSAYYLSCNRNKKSVTIDIATKEGQEIIHQLLEQSDVLIENFKVGGLKKYGLDYDSLKEKYPDLIYCSITGFGQQGPLSSEPGYDFIAQAMGGLMAATGAIDGEPMKAGVALSDIMSGLYAVIGILAALQSGKGQHVDIALLNVTMAGMTNLAQYYLTSGAPAKRYGNAHSTIVPYQCFKAKDGYIVIAIGNNTQFSRFAAHLDHGEWTDDPRFATNEARVTNRDVLVPMIAEALLHKTVDAWVEDFRAIDVPAGPVNPMDSAFDQAPHMKISQDGVDMVASPLNLSQTPVTYHAAPPRLGQHTLEILRALGYDEAALTRLKSAHII